MKKWPRESMVAGVPRQGWRWSEGGGLTLGGQFLARAPAARSLAGESRSSPPSAKSNGHGFVIACWVSRDYLLSLFPNHMPT